MKNETQNSVKQVTEKYTVRTVRGCKESASLSLRRGTAWPTSRRGAATTRRGRRRGRRAPSSGFHQIFQSLEITGIMCQLSTLIIQLKLKYEAMLI